MNELDFFGSDARFHHVGLAVKSIGDASPPSKVITDPVQRVSVAFVSVNGMQIELIEPYGEDSPVTETLRKGGRLHHICYTVSDMATALRECRKHGLHCIARPTPAVAYQGRKIAWVYSTTYGLFELLQDSV